MWGVICAYCLTGGGGIWGTADFPQGCVPDAGTGRGINRLSPSTHWGFLCPLMLACLSCFCMYLGTRSFHVLIAVQLADAFSAVTLLVGHQEEHSACKNWVMGCWCGYLSGARCRLFAYGPADATAIPNAVIFCLIYIQTGLPFWYRLTQVVLEKRPLNRCSSQLVNAAS